MPKPRFEDTAPDIVRDLLLLVGIDIPETTVAAWTPQQRCVAQRYAARAYLRASDNPVRVPPEPEFVTEARQDLGASAAVQTQHFASVLPQKQDLAPARRWASAWKNGARHYRGLFHDAVRQGARYDMAIEALIYDIEAQWYGLGINRDIVDRLREIREEMQKL